jgi:hypothetical protein
MQWNLDVSHELEWLNRMTSSDFFEVQSRCGVTLNARARSPLHHVLLVVLMLP